MDMLEIYLEAIAAHLPRDAAPDIVAELRDTLLSQFEEREDSLGRALTDEERQEVLRAMGHPLAVAARYRTGPQQLIGPELFPYWLFAVKAGLLILAAAYALILLIGLVSSPFDAGRAVVQSVHGLFGAGLTLIGVATLAGAICEHFGLRPGYLDTWRVEDLQILKLADPASWAAQLSADLPIRGLPRLKPQRVWPGSEAMVSLVAGILFVAWWIGVLHIPGMAGFDLKGSKTAVEAAPVWAALYLPILAYALAEIAVDAVGVARPAAIRLRAVLQIPIAVAGIALMVAIFQAGHWFTLVRGGERAAVGGDGSLLDLAALHQLHGIDRDLPSLALGLGVILSWVLVITAIGLGVKIAKSLWQIYAAGRR